MCFFYVLVQKKQVDYFGNFGVVPASHCDTEKTQLFREKNLFTSARQGESGNCKVSSGMNAFCLLKDGHFAHIYIE